MPNMQLGYTHLIRSTAAAYGCLPAQEAYILATGAWETAGSMEPVEEAFYLGSRARTYREGLRYAPWWGRGFVQLTWERNYIAAGKKLGLDLTTDPTAAMEPVAAAKILVHGSMEGWFTGKGIPAFISATACDFVGARRVINGTDRAADIAALAVDYLAAISPALPATIRRGSTGAPVPRLQLALDALGFDAGAPDGIFGRRTEEALRAFQLTRGLDPDGICGPATWGALNEGA